MAKTSDWFPHTVGEHRESRYLIRDQALDAEPTRSDFGSGIDNNPCHDRSGMKGLPMNVSLTPSLEQLIRQKVEAGAYNNASEVVR